MTHKSKITLPLHLYSVTTLPSKTQQVGECSLDNEIHTKTTFFRLILTFQLRLKSSSEPSV